MVKRALSPLIQLRQDLSKAVGAHLAKYGFSAKINSSWFYIKKIPAGRVGVHISFFNRSTFIEVTMSVAVRFDAVENIRHLNRPEVIDHTRERSKTWTFGATMTSLCRDWPYLQAVHSMEDVERVASHIDEACRRFALPYFEKYSDPEIVYQEFKARHVGVHSVDASRAALVAICLAKLLGHEDELPELISEKKAFLSDHRNGGLARIDSLLRAIYGGGATLH